MSICDALRQRVGMLLTYFGLLIAAELFFFFEPRGRNMLI